MHLDGGAIGAPSSDVCSSAMYCTVPVLYHTVPYRTILYRQTRTQVGALLRRFAEVRVAGAPTQSLQLALACVVDMWPDSFARYIRGYRSCVYPIHGVVIVVDIGGQGWSELDTGWSEC